MALPTSRCYLVFPVWVITCCQRVKFKENHLQQLIINYTNEVLVDLWHQDCIRDDQDRMISEVSQATGFSISAYQILILKLSIKGLNWRKLEESETCDSVKFLDNQLKTVVDGHNCFSNFSHKCSISVSSNEDSQIIMSHFGRKVCLKWSTNWATIYFWSDFQVSYKLDSWCSNTSASLSFIAKFVTSCNHPLLRLLFPQNSTEEFMFGTG